jgi:hypothetical protein
MRMKGKVIPEYKILFVWWRGGKYPPFVMLGSKLGKVVTFAPGYLQPDERKRSQYHLGGSQSRC